MDLIIHVHEVKGNCPVYKQGDFFELQDGYKLVSNHPLCMHALSALIPYYNALRFTEPAALGLAGKKSSERAYIQCSDAMAYTDGGTVIFEIEKNETGC